ncbi:UNVERIFIED_CONTAM: hypothetical protein ABID98_003788 [Brevibacillus sp. OAP136]|nr:hypothetical protein [Brevibacillus fluminis]
METRLMEEAYLYTVMQLLPHGINKEHVLQELRSQISESVKRKQAKGLSERDAMLETFKQLGSPREIANQYAGNHNVTRLQLAVRLFAMNVLLFLVGSAIVILQAYLSSPAKQQFWLLAQEHKYQILGVYSLLWLVCGYVIGKLYGFSLRRWLGRIIHVPLSLNYVFMLLILFRFIPTDWFGGVLNTDFVIISVVVTALLSVFSLVGFHVGARSKSVRKD